MPALGAKEAVFNLNLAFLDPGDAALAADPGYPVYTGGPLLAGGEAVLMPLLPERGFAPDLEAVAPADRERARLMFLNYPNNPTGAVVPDGLFEEAVEFGRRHDVLVVHDASYTETTFDGYVAPSFLATPGRARGGRRGLLALQGLEHDGLAHRGGGGERRGGGGLLAAQDQHRLGHVRGGAAGGGRGARRRARPRDDRRVRAPARPGVRRAGGDRRGRGAPRGTIYVWAPVPAGHDSASFCELVLEESGVVVSPGAPYGPNGEGFFRISLTVADERLAEAVERLRSSMGG